MKNINLILILIIVCSVMVFGQQGLKKSLVVKNCEATEGICDTQHLYRYDFVDGQLIGKEKILSTQTLDVRFDLGKNIIYQNKYLITNWGDIIDLIKKEVVHKSKGELLRVEQDKVFIKVNRTDKNGLFVFDLAMNQYSLVRKLDDGLDYGELSPNGLRSAVWICNVKNNCGIRVSKYGGKSKILKGDFPEDKKLNYSSSEMLRVPILWLDESRMLTQSSNGKLVILDLNNKISQLLQIKIDETPDHYPEIFRNGDGQIIYSCGRDFIIDVDKKSFAPADKSAGNGFSEKDDDSVKSNFGTGKVFFYQGNEIGRIWSTSPITTNDYMAVEYGQNGSNLGYPDGIKVWSNDSKTWTTIEIKWGPEIIGWLNDK